MPANLSHSALRLRNFKVGLHLFELRSGRHWTHGSLFVTDDISAHLLLHGIDERVVNRALDEDPRSRDTDSTGVHEEASNYTRYGRGQISICEDDVR